VSPPAMVDVVVSLLTNGIDASPPGGEVAVRTCRADGDCVEIVVADEGPGVPPELRDRIFEPFFSTKEVGRGTGLGLSMARRVVDALGGDLHVLSEPGRGATFVVRLPVEAVPDAPGVEA